MLHASPELGRGEISFNNTVLDTFDYEQESDWITVDPGLVRVTTPRERLGINTVVFDLAYERFTLIITDPLLIPAPRAAPVARAHRPRFRRTSKVK